jgi:hypothetical protein
MQNANNNTNADPRLHFEFCILHHLNTTNTVFASTDDPSLTRTSATVPLRGARSSFSIFIASTTTSGWRAETVSSGLTSTLTIRPGIGATIVLAPSAAPRSPAPRRVPFPSGFPPGPRAIVSGIATPLTWTINSSAAPGSTETS